MATFNLGDGSGKFISGDEDDLINAFGGEDDVEAGGGNDTVNGGSGDDFIRGQAGNDQLFGDDGNDSLIGNEGNDELFGGNGTDFLDGLDGNDLLVGQGGEDDLLFGGDGDDTLITSDGHSTLHGGLGDDLFQIDAVNIPINDPPSISRSITIQDFTAGDDIIDVSQVIDNFGDLQNSLGTIRDQDGTSINIDGGVSTIFLDDISIDEVSADFFQF